MEKNNIASERLVQTGDEGVEIDLLELLGVFLDEWHLVALCGIAGALLLNAWSYFMIHPTYQATSKLYIVSASKDSMVDITDLNLGTSLTADYEELIMSYPVLDQVMAIAQEETGVSFEGVDATAFGSCIALSNPSNTRLLDVTVTTEDPALSVSIANAVSEVAKDYLPRTMSISRPNVAQVAREPDYQAGPSYFRFTLIGGLLGALLFCGFLTMRHVTDDTIKTGDDVERELGFVPLAQVPESAVFAAADASDDMVVEGTRSEREKPGGWRSLFKKR